MVRLGVVVNVGRGSGEIVPVQITPGWSIFKVNFLVPASSLTTSFTAVILIFVWAADI